MPTIKANDITLHYKLDGAEDAPPLLMSNSLGTNLSMWDKQAEQFARTFRVIRYDSRGHGKSDAPKGPYTIEMLANDALALLDALHIKRTNFCGLSKGGMVGQWLGAHAGERLNRMVISNTSPFMPPRELWDQRIEAATEGGMERLLDMIIGRWFTADFVAGNPMVIEKVRQMILSTPPQGYAACCMAIRDMDQRDALTAIRTPTLVIAGAVDPATPPDHAELIHSLIKDSQLVSLPAAHLSNIEQPAAFTKTVLDFLQKD